MLRLAALAVVALIASPAAAEMVARPRPAAGAPAGPRMHRPPPNDDLDEIMEPFGTRAAPRKPPPPPPRREVVRKALAKQRARHLAAFHAYRKRGVFAHDLDGPGEVYVWLDADGRLDVIPALMVADGMRAIVDARAHELEGKQLVQFGQNEVGAWMLQSGFALDEIDRMQRTHVRPAIVREGDTSWRADEDARLATAYAAVASYLKSHADDGLDAATDALMARSDLAWQLVRGRPRAHDSR